MIIENTYFYISQSNTFFIYEKKIQKIVAHIVNICGTSKAPNLKTTALRYIHNSYYRVK